MRYPSVTQDIILSPTFPPGTSSAHIATRHARSVAYEEQSSGNAWRISVMLPSLYSEVVDGSTRAACQPPPPHPGPHSVGSETQGTSMLTDLPRSWSGIEPGLCRGDKHILSLFSFLDEKTQQGQQDRQRDMSAPCNLFYESVFERVAVEDGLGCFVSLCSH